MYLSPRRGGRRKTLEDRGRGGLKKRNDKGTFLENRSGHQYFKKRREGKDDQKKTTINSMDQGGRGDSRRESGSEESL